MNLLNIIIFCLGVVVYSLKELQSHGKLKWMKDDKPYGFWGKLSYRRKYKKYYPELGERWPTSTNLTVMFTDFYHLMQFCYKVLFIVTIVTYQPFFNARLGLPGMFWDFIIYFLLWGAVFSLAYKYLSK